MALQTSGAITLAEIQTEFGGANPISMSEYYAGGAYVPSGTSGTNGAVPTSGQISFSQFYGTSDYTAPVWTPDGGSSGPGVTLSSETGGGDDAFVTISCTQSVTWTWFKTGSSAAYASIGSGGSDTSITFTLFNAGFSILNSSFSVSATDGTTTRYWTVNLTNDGFA